MGSTLKLLSEVYPYQVHTNATLTIFNNIEKTTEDKALKSIIFDGQGTAKVLERFEEGLSQAKASDHTLNTPQIDASLSEIENLNSRKSDKLNQLNQLRAKLYLDNIKDNKITDKATSSINQTISNFINQNLIEECTSTIAFQTALVITFIDMVEKLYEEEPFSANDWSNKFNFEDQNLTIQLLNEYIESLNNFFKPSSLDQLNALISIFEGKLEKVEASETIGFKIVKSNESFRSVVMLDREMKPDEWPKYRYLLLKAWQTSNTMLSSLITGEIIELEKDILESLFIKLKRELSKELIIDESDLTSEDISKCKNQSTSRFNSLLSNIRIAQTA